MDITPEFIEQARKHGFKNLDIQKLIQLKTRRRSLVSANTESHMKHMIRAVAALVFCALVFSQVAHAAEEFKGNWTIRPAEAAGQVEFGLMHRMHGGRSQPRVQLAGR